ncbi:SDR family NAD(P)-dependent oxidoreductase [Synechococcus sp. UW105]|uniref:SDR family NAD(P)-dependent oxidoreductase n=1 Tax=Synechococcus sp. UW105 TaxID=337067 RepID=UPI000E0EDD5D|nr:SDR family oxidoreductase [Synechococcus sp. UW105]
MAPPSDVLTPKKVALVTGSSQGIGYFIAKELHTEGYDVVLNGRQNTTLQQAVRSLPGSVGYIADVSVPNEAERLITHIKRQFGCLDSLVCNVGSGRSVPPGEESFDEWKRVFANNFLSTTNVVEASIPLLTQSNGSIVCISSICGLEVVNGAPVTYSSAKAALNAYVRGIARPLGVKGVRINAIAPGNILFEGSIWRSKLKENQVHVYDMLKKEVSLNKFGSPENIAQLVHYLLSPKADFVTGAIWTIDGGQTKS